MKRLLLLILVLRYSADIVAQCSTTIIFPHDSSVNAINDLTQNDPLLWNKLGVVDQQNMVSNLSESQTELSLVVHQQCNAIISCTLYLDLDNNQVLDTSVPSDSFDVYPAGSIRTFNLNTDGFLYQFDARNIPLNDLYQFDLISTASGDSTITRLVWSGDVTPQLPYGKHRIDWVVDNQMVSQTVVIRDAGLPNVICLNGLSANLMNTTPASVILWDTDFTTAVYDNATPANLLKTAIRRAGSGSGFPVNSDGTPQKQVSFNCDDLGFNILELWVKDFAGNENYCETQILIQDNMGVCTIVDTGNLEICITTAAGEPMTEPLQSLITTIPGFIQTNINGCNQYAYSFGTDLTITPQLDIDPLNGVTTFDLVLIARHILNKEPLDSPYKIIAADANKSNTVTSLDILEFRYLILGIYDHLPANTSWRFINAQQEFTNPLNPFAMALMENITIQNMPTDTSYSFIGVKIGDVNNTASPGLKSAADERLTPVPLFVENKQIEAGETVRIPVYLPSAGNYEGAQMELSIDPIQVVLVNILPNTLWPEMNEDLFFMPASDRVRFSWINSYNRFVPDDKPLFWVELIGLQATSTVNCIKLKGNGLAAEVYHNSNGILKADPLELKILEPEKSITRAFPNPTTNGFKIATSFSSQSNGIVCIYDINGQICFKKAVNCIPDQQWIDIPETALPYPGIYNWSIRTESGIDLGGNIIKQ